LFLVCDQHSLAGLWTQNYNSVCSGYNLCHPVNIQTQKHSNRWTERWTAFDQLIWKARPAELKNLIILTIEPTTIIYKSTLHCPLNCVVGDAYSVRHNSNLK